MRWLYRFLLIFSVCVLVVAFYPKDVGDVVIRIPTLGTFYTTPLVLFIIMVLMWATLFSMLQLSGWAWSLPRNLVATWRQKRIRRADERLLTGWIWLSSGGYSEALGIAEKTYQSGLASNESALLAARSAMKMDLYDLSLEWLNKVKSSEKRHQLIKDIMQAKLHLHHHKPEAAMAVIHEIESQSGFNSVTGRFKVQAFMQAEQWSEMMKLIRKLHKMKFAAQSDVDLWSFQARDGELQTLLRKAQEKNEPFCGLILSWWKRLEEQEQTNVRLLDKTLVLLVQNVQEQSEKEPLPEKTNRACEWLTLAINALLNHHDKPEFDATRKTLNTLMAHFAKWAEVKQLDKAIEACHGWLNRLPENAGTLRTLGQLYERRELWGNAIRFYETALTFEPHEETLRRLAALHDQIGQVEKAKAWRTKLLALRHDS